MMKRSILLSCVAACLLAACAPVTQRPTVDDKAIAIEARKQSGLAYRDLLDDRARLYRVSYPILARGAPMCEEKLRPSTGFRFTSLEDVPKDYREAASFLLGLTNEIQVIQVIKGSPAEQSGIREADIIVAVDGKRTPAGDRASDKLTEAFREATKAKKQVPVNVRRNGIEMSLSITHESICDYPVVLNPADFVNAFATGSEIIITRGMLRFIRDDLELAVVVGHELAHNTMNHINKQRGNVLLGTLVDILAAVKGVNTQGMFGNLAGLVFSKEFEAEADYVGLYFTARAGFDVANAPNFWRRMATVNPGAIQRAFISTHPSTPERFLALEKVVEEIQAKKTARKNLTPELAK